MDFPMVSLDSSSPGDVYNIYIVNIYIYIYMYIYIYSNILISNYIYKYIYIYESGT